MLRHHILVACKSQCRRSFTTTPTKRVHQIPSLLPRDATLETFRTQAFNPALPILLPEQFTHLPAIKTWFLKDSNTGNISLNRQYLDQFGETIVPLEITTQEGKFMRVEQELSWFLEATSPPPSPTNPEEKTPQIYLAQSPLSSLPPSLQQKDLPTPTLVLTSGKGDIYASSLWLGHAPTYTPLHRDPNPNLFIQLSGSKLIRMYHPRIGLQIFENVQEKIGGSGNAMVRGVEMMEGVEREVLEDAVWGRDDGEECWEAEVRSGDGLFIPKGWWHSIRSGELSRGMTGSVNWWFR